MTDENTQGKPAKRASKAKTPATPTDYVVVEQHMLELETMDGGERKTVEAELWRKVDDLTASGQEKTLIEKWAEEKKRTGTFKLIPARSWKGGVRVFEKTELTSEAIA